MLHAIFPAKRAASPHCREPLFFCASFGVQVLTCFLYMEFCFEFCFFVIRICFGFRISDLVAAKGRAVCSVAIRSIKNIKLCKTNPISKMPKMF